MEIVAFCLLNDYIYNADHSLIINNGDRMKYNVVIIGSGPGGYVSAIRASQLGLNVAIIEKDVLGGVCLNWGCIPTKSFLRSAEIVKIIKHSDDYGIKSKLLDVDIKGVVKRSRDIAKNLSNGVKYLLKKNNVDVVTGKASFVNKNRIEIIQADGSQVEIESDNFVIATGGRPQKLPFVNSSEDIWYYKEALQPTDIPKNLLVVGSGAIGVEFASFYNQMGSNVTVLESQDRIVPNEDYDVSSFVEKQFLNKKIKIFKTCLLKEVNKKLRGVNAVFTVNQKEYSFDYDKIIIAVGITGNIEDLNTEVVGINCESQRIVVDDYCRTNVENIFAIGDVANAPWLAHKASHEGVVVAEIIAGKKSHSIKRENIPACTFCDPEIASIGLTEENAKEEKLEFKTGIFPFSANGKALAMGYKDGFIKTIIDKKTGEFIGVHMVGAGVTELIHNFSLVKEAEIIQENIENTIFPHPTLSEAIHESVLKASNREIHI